ncbi:MAG: FMN-dependent NADH-azoreductase [Verrucomicrobiales bacterium]|nr:FMN-dependent NADH-azoreductase [Verrucomicrobiales bacterium]
MKTLLRIDASARLSDSHSRRLGDTFESTWRERHPDAVVVRRDLAVNPPPHLSGEVLSGFFRGERDTPALGVSNELVDELMACDAILVTCPVYNFHVPSTLKAWIDLVVREGETFFLDDSGNRTGLLAGKRAYVIVARGGEVGSPNGIDPVGSYLAGILRFIGIEDTTVFSLDETVNEALVGEKIDELRERMRDSLMPTTHSKLHS